MPYTALLAMVAAGAVLGPVRETASHPGQSPLGWTEFERIATRTQQLETLRAADALQLAAAVVAAEQEAASLELVTLDDRLAEAAERYWCLIVQREAIGITHHDDLVEVLQIPDEDALGGKGVQPTGPRRGEGRLDLASHAVEEADHPLEVVGLEGDGDAGLRHQHAKPGCHPLDVGDAVVEGVLVLRRHEPLGAVGPRQPVRLVQPAVRAEPERLEEPRKVARCIL